jgi:hypothetical protein
MNDIHFIFDRRQSGKTKKIIEDTIQFTSVKDNIAVIIVANSQTAKNIKLRLKDYHQEKNTHILVFWSIQKLWTDMKYLGLMPYNNKIRYYLDEPEMLDITWQEFSEIATSWPGSIYLIGTLQQPIVIPRSNSKAYSFVECAIMSMFQTLPKPEKIYNYI